jgi:hypothetical protein
VIQENQVKLSLQGMSGGNIGIIYINLNQWIHPYLQKVEGLNEQQKALLEKAIDKFIINNKMCPKEYINPTNQKEKSRF